MRAGARPTAAPPSGGAVRVLAAADLAVKLALYALLVLALVVPDLAGIKARAVGARLVLYPAGTLAVPLWWWAYGRLRRGRGRGPESFPWAADLLVSLPWFLDTLGNRLNLFLQISWFDNLMHWLNWLLLTSGVLLAWAPRRPPSVGVVVMCALGFGAPAAVLWEVAEWASFLRGTGDPARAYRDTLGDLSLGTLGSLTAGLVLGLLWWRRRAGPPVRVAP